MTTSAETGHAIPGSTQALYVLPSERGDGFHANIRGHPLELADPDSGHALAPTPDDLLVASIAADLAWSARTFLRARRLPASVSISVAWRTQEDSRLADIDVTVTVPTSAEAVSAELIAALEKSAVERSLNAPLRVRLQGAYGQAYAEGLTHAAGLRSNGLATLGAEQAALLPTARRSAGP